VGNEELITEAHFTLDADHHLWAIAFKVSSIDDVERIRHQLSEILEMPVAVFADERERLAIELDAEDM
jgi:hypothetical protein